MILMLLYFRGKWHGEIAIKMLKTDPDRDNQAQLQAFKLEVCVCLCFMVT